MKYKIFIALTILSLVSIEGLAQKTDVKKDTKKTVETTVTTKTETAKMPTVKEILDNYIKALGGRAAHEKLKNRVSKGTIELSPMGLKGSFESYTAMPDKSYTKMNFTGLGEIIEAYDGTTAWTINPLQGNRDKSGDELKQTKLLYDFQRDLNLEKNYSKLELKPMQKVGDKDVYVIVATPNNGLDAETWYFDKTGGLLVKSDTVAVSPEGKLNSTSFYDDYREVDGVKIAHKLRSVLPQFEVITVITETKHNVGIDDKMFSKAKQ